MPIIVLPIPETMESVTRPVCLEVVRDVMEITGISSKTNIVFPGDLDKVQQLNSAITGKNEDDPNRFAYNDRISIEVVETYDPDRVLNEAVIQPNHRVVFEDVLLNTIMKPVFTGVEVAINFKYRCNNKNEATKWRDDMKIRVARRREVNVHRPVFHYGFPPEFLFLLKEIHRMRENRQGYGEDFDAYWKKYRSPYITNLMNQSGSAAIWVVPFTEGRVEGWFDFELPEEGSKEDNQDTWTLSFAYKFRYERPLEMLMTYPIMVHQQVLDQRYREPAVSIENERVQEWTFQAGNLYGWETESQVFNAVHRVGHSMPSFDEFLPSSVPIDTMRLLTILLSLDENDPHNFLSLKEMGSWKFTPEMLEFLAGEAKYMTRLYGSAVMINFYRNQFLIDPTPLKVNANLDVTSTAVVNLRDVHRVRISLVSDLHLINRDAQNRMCEHGKATIQILEALDDTLRERGYMPTLRSDRWITRNEYLYAINNLRPGYKARGRLLDRQTVQSLIIQA